MHDRQSQSGRQGTARQPANSTLEKLDDALSILEKRMGIAPGTQRNAADMSHPPAAAPRQPLVAQRGDDDIAAIRARQEAIARSETRTMPPRYQNVPEPRRSNHGSDLDLRAELETLRHQLNSEMSSTMAHQFDAMRQEMSGLRAHGSDISAADLSDGFNRLTRELGLVASRVGESDVGSLKSEVEELKQHVAALAREDTLREMSERWSVIEREIGSLPQKLGSRQDLLSIAERIADINEAMMGLPDSRVMDAMEGQLRTLAEAVEVLASRDASIAPDHLISIEERLDEISRAIIAVSVSSAPPEMDSAPFERIEARLTALARQFDERTAPTGNNDAVENRLMEIGARLDSLHAVSAGANAGDALDNMTARLEELAQRLDSDTGRAPAISDAVINDLNARFEEISQRLESNHQSAESTGARMLESLDSRMEELARRIEENERESATVPTFDHMERRIEEIAQMLSSGDAFAAVQPSGDTSAIQNLEIQIASLSDQLSTVASMPANSEFAELAPRLIAVSEQLAGGREEMISAARAAAEEAVGRISGNATGAEREVLAQLANDLGSLEDLARNSDDRNVRTFEAIHDTLVKVADRIAGLEDTIRSGHAERPAAPHAAMASAPMPRAPMPSAPMHDMPDMDETDIDDIPTPAHEPSLTDDKGREAPNPYIPNAPSVDIAEEDDAPASPLKRRGEAPPRSMSPADAAAFAARAATEDDPYSPEEPIVPAISPDSGEKGQRGLLSGLRNAISRGNRDKKGSGAQHEPAAFVHSEMPGEEADFSDEPLEPGSGAPDLAAIMKRVRTERAVDAPGETGPEADDDAGKSDFIAAARRAARAAAAEASVLEAPGADTAGLSSGKKGRLTAARKPLLIGAGAILLALLALPLVRGFLSGSETMPAQITQLDETATVGPEASIGRQIDEQVATTDDASELQTEETAAVTVPESPRVAVQSVDEAPMETAVIPAEPAGEQPAFTVLSPEEIPNNVGPIMLREAAVDGDPKAFFVIGERLMGTGPGTAGSDAAAAATWYKMAAEQGLAPAQYRIGNFYEKGIGVARDLDAAKTWYQLAAEQGNASAMHNLAVLFATEIDGKRDMASAGRWFVEAAELGVTDSQVNLGILSARGEGVEQNLVESYKWLALAADAGDNDALAKRDEVAGFMRPDQLEMARGAVELWKPKAVNVLANTVEIPDSWKTDQAVTAANPPAPSAEMRKAVQNIQAILNNNGFDAGPADGVMGTKTRTAIIEFQKAQGMAPTGEVDRMLVDKLLEINKQS